MDSLCCINGSGLADTRDFSNPGALYLPALAAAHAFQKHLNNCTFILLQLLLIREPNQRAVARYSLRQRLSCLLISLSLLSVHITTSFCSLLSSIFLHVTAAYTLLLPDFHYTVLTLFQLHYLISASHSENQIYGIFFFFSFYNVND